MGAPLIVPQHPAVQPGVCAAPAPSLEACEAITQRKTSPVIALASVRPVQISEGNDLQIARYPNIVCVCGGWQPVYAPGFLQLSAHPPLGHYSFTHFCQKEVTTKFYCPRGVLPLPPFHREPVQGASGCFAAGWVVTWPSVSLPAVHCTRHT